MANHYIIDGQNGRVRPLPAWLARGLRRAPRAFAVQDALGAMRLRGERIECRCGRIFYLAHGRYIYLRLGRDQVGPPPGGGCELCRGAGRPHTARRAGRRAPVDGTWLLTAEPPRTALDWPRRGWTILRHLLAGAGFEQGAGPKLAWDEVWRRVAAAAAELIAGDGARAWGRFVWTPAVGDGLVEFNRRMCAAAQLSAFAGAAGARAGGGGTEGWVCAILSDPLPRLTGDGATWLEFRLPLRPPGHVAAVPVERLGVAAAAVARAGCTPPFFLFAVCAPSDAVGRSLHCYGVWLQSIYAVSRPVPVRSAYERQLAARLVAAGIPFRKPLADSPPRPDLELPADRLLIEVGGVDAEGYADRKLRAHRRALATPRYADYRLLRWAAAAGEPLDAFWRELEAARRGASLTSFATADLDHSATAGAKTDADSSARRY